MANEFNYRNYLKNNPLLAEAKKDEEVKEEYKKDMDEEMKKDMDEEMKGDMKKKSSKMKLSELKSKIKEKVLEEMKDKKDLDEMDAVAWNEKNNPTRSKSVTLKDPRKVGQSTSDYYVNVDEEMKKDMDEEMKKDMDEEMKDMDESTFRGRVAGKPKRIRTKVDTYAGDGVAEQEDVEVTDDENVDIDIEKDVDIDDKETESDIRVRTSVPGESTEVEAVQGLLTKAQQQAEKLGDEKLLAQIGNTITYFTRKHVVKV